MTAFDVRARKWLASCSLARNHLLGDAASSEEHSAARERVNVLASTAVRLAK